MTRQQRAYRCAPVAMLAAGAAVTTYWGALSSQSQLLGPFPFRAVQPATRPRVALTFDDGPNEPFTSRLAEALGQRGVRATFFQVGKAVSRFPETSSALLAAGHVIGNHSQTHTFGRCFTAAAVEDEVRRAQDTIAEVIGRVPGLYRPPWLARTPATFASLRRHGLNAVSGTFCHPLEVARIPAGRIARRALARAAPGRILIFHDGYNGEGADRTRTLDAVLRVVDTLGENGWEFTTVDRLLDLDPYQRMGTGRSNHASCTVTAD